MKGTAQQETPTQNAERLRVTELFTQVFNLLRIKHGANKMTIRAIAKVGDDSDGHRRRIGNMVYEKAIILTAGQKSERRWIIALSTESQGYPANAYACDITAIKIGERLPKDPKKLQVLVEKSLEGSEYFRNSLMIGMSNSGAIGSVNKEVIAELQGLMKDYIAEGPIRNDEVVNMDGSPIYSSVTRYKPEAVAGLAAVIERVIEKK